MVSNVDLIASSILTANLVIAATTVSPTLCLVNVGICVVSLLFLLFRNVEIDFYDEDDMGDM